jgi:ribonuclease-3
LRLRPIKPVNTEYFSDKTLKQAIKSIFGYKPGNIYLYHQAFLHRSASQESQNGIRVNNERLEFLGDAILDAVAADHLFKTFPTRDEGFLTEMRSKLVSRNVLNKLSQKLGVDQLVMVDSSSSGAFKSFRGDAFEALIGAMYLDKGYDFTRKIILERIIRQYFNMDELVNQEVNFKSRIIEWAQREKKSVQFVVAEEVGTGYRKQYIVDLVIDGETVSSGRDYSIKGAEQNGSEKAWQKINKETIDLG